MKTEKELKEEIAIRNLKHRKKAKRLNIKHLGDNGWDDTVELEAKLQALQERNAEVKQAIDEFIYGDAGCRGKCTACFIELLQKLGLEDGG